jgi:hypothetical protein
MLFAIALVCVAMSASKMWIILKIHLLNYLT